MCRSIHPVSDPATMLNTNHGNNGQKSFQRSRPLFHQITSNSAAGSVLMPGRTIAKVKWVLTDGGGIVDGFVDGIDDALTVAVRPWADGSFVVGVTVTDDRGASASASQTVAVGSAITQPGGSGGGGGGAMGLVWLALLAAATIAAARSNRARERRLSRA